MSAEPEIRIDPLTGLRAILAPGRAERPGAFSSPAIEPKPDAAESCPFCEGREDRTPPEVWTDRPEGDADTPGWRTRSVPNLYPAVSGHEVIVHSPRHVTRLAELSIDELASVLDAWRARIAAHPEAEYVQLIVNEGPAAGASLEHSHAQLYPLPFVPAQIARERERSSAHHEETQGSHLLEDLVAEELRAGERVVGHDEDGVLLCPVASRSPFELRLVPRAAGPRFQESQGCGPLLARALAAIDAALGSPQLNLWLRNAPRGADEFCWHLDIAPRLVTKAGFEFSTGVDICTYPPERAAADLRDSLP